MWQNHQLNKKRDMYILHAELSHCLEVITQATGLAMEFHHTSMLKPCEDYDLGKTIKVGSVNRLIMCSKILGERLLFEISTSSTPTFVSTKLWLLILKDSS